MKAMHPYLAFVGSLVMVALLGLAVYFAGWEYSLSIFFLLPIFLCVHYAGKWPGVVMALVSGATLLVLDLFVSGHPYTHQIIGYWNGVALVGFFLIFTVLMASVEEALHREKGINRNLESLLTLAPYDQQWQLPFNQMDTASLPTKSARPVPAPEDEISSDEELGAEKKVERGQGAEDRS